MTSPIGDRAQDRQRLLVDAPAERGRIRRSLVPVQQRGADHFLELLNAA